MEALQNHYYRLLHATKTTHFRYLYKQIRWHNRLVAIVGARGTGKTTLMLQHIKATFPDKSKALYASLDNIWFSQNTLLDLAEKFHAYGGTHLFLDEVHKYPNWSIEVKNVYDSFPDLHVVFTGSSMLKIYSSEGDLSRRAISYSLAGLSFREFLLFENKLEVIPLALEEILTDHVEFASEITAEIKILPEFKRYLKHGYYPFYKEDIASYPMRLQNAINIILENDLPAVEHVEYLSVQKIKKMLMVVASMVPFTPNIVNLSSEIETGRNAIVKYLDYLQKAGLILSLSSPKKNMGSMSKPDKIYLNNSNLLYALSDSSVNAGTLRETFFANQLSVNHAVNTAMQGDFTVDKKYVFEVGGKGKGFKQIRDIKDSYVATDDIEIGYGCKIPLWLFGMTY
ncbi:MAG: AAA family ATPase [Prevotellaceae bacterium]|jgi:predicted AAA+ superfamily ATPase|nr:AAA family ATPase [Prevotellaceae bacterium]